MSRRAIFAVIAGAVVMLGIAGAALIGGRAWAQGAMMHAGMGMHAGMMKRMASAALDEALDQAKVTAEQRTTIYASRDRAFAAFEQNRPNRLAHRDQVLSLFESDKLDRAQLQALHTQMQQQHDAIRDAVAQAVVEIHDTLTPEQRRVVANYARQFGPGMMR